MFGATTTIFSVRFPRLQIPFLSIYSNSLIHLSIFHPHQTITRYFLFISDYFGICFTLKNHIYNLLK